MTLEKTIVYRCNLCGLESSEPSEFWPFIIEAGKTLVCINEVENATIHICDACQNLIQGLP